ncbi:MAG: hypothetical protein AAFW46_16825, partial [Pseudomonadota bacterium]
MMEIKPPAKALLYCPPGQLSTSWRVAERGRRPTKPWFRRLQSIENFSVLTNKGAFCIDLDHPKAELFAC